VKNKVPIDWPLLLESAKVVHHYVDRYRDILDPASGAYIFPAARGRDGSRNPGTFARDIKRAIAEYVGVTMNVHLFRGFAAKILLEDNPGALEDLRRILGHRGLNTILAHYAALAPAAAARRYDALIEKSREDSKHLVRQRSRRTRGGKRG
jgi:integrase